MNQVKRCEGCDEPEFMCVCSKEFQGKTVTHIYHRGEHLDGQQAKRNSYLLPLRPTVIINHICSILRSPFRHEVLGYQGV